MASICRAAIHLCRIRATRLDSTGAPVGGANNAYVTDKPITLGVTPVIEEGEDITLVGGCDCIVAAYRGEDKLKRFDLALQLAVIEPALLEMMIGASAISQGGQISGLWWPNTAFNCGVAGTPLVALEGWQDAWDVDRQSSAPFRYIHWVFPATKWQIGESTLGNEFFQPSLNGYTRSNANWGLGIYGDAPEVAQPLGGFYYTNTLPSAVCDYQTEGLT